MKHDPTNATTNRPPRCVDIC